MQKKAPYVPQSVWPATSRSAAKRKRGNKQRPGWDLAEAAWWNLVLKSRAEGVSEPDAAEVAWEFFRQRNRNDIPSPRSIQRHVREWLKKPRPEPTPFEKLPLLRQIELLIRKLPAEAWPRIVAMRPVGAEPPRLEDEFLERLVSTLTAEQRRRLRALLDAVEE